MGRGAEAEAVFRDLTDRRPKNLRHLHCLGMHLQKSGRPVDAAPILDRAVAEYREAIRLQPDDGTAHYYLGTILCDVKYDYAAAAAEFREAVRLQPHYASAHFCLGNALAGQGKLAEAVAECREAIRLQPDFTDAHNNLGAFLARQGKLAEAVAESREAIRLQPDAAGAYNNLAFNMLELGDIASAMRSVREALRLDPRSAPALSTLSETLLVAGRFGEAVPALERVADGRGLPAALMAHSKGLIPKARWLAAHVAPLTAPAVDAPAGLTATDLAAGALAADRPALAARIYELVLTVSPARADNLDTGHRYKAARAAARAGCGRDKNDPPLDHAEQADLRRLALGWLRGDLAAWGRVVDGGDPKIRAGAVQILTQWKDDGDLAGVRDTAALAKLPESERGAWRRSGPRSTPCWAMRGVSALEPAVAPASGARRRGA